MLIDQPKTVLISDGSPSAICLTLFMISARCVASASEGGLNRHSSASGTAWVTLRQFWSMSMPAMKMSSIKLSATMSRGGR